MLAFALCKFLALDVLKVVIISCFVPEEKSYPRLL